MKHIKKFFEEMSQVLFFKSMVFGVLFVALAVFFNQHLFLCGLATALIGFIYSQTTRTPKILKDYGMLTVNGFFFGIAMASFFEPSMELYAYLLIGALAVPFVTKAAYEVLQHWKLSPFIIPYILVVWVFILSANAMAFNILPEPELLKKTFALVYEYNNSDIGLNILHTIFVSIGRIFFLPSAFFGFALLVLVSAFSPRQGFFMLAGTAVAVLVGYVLMSQFHTDIGLSQYSYSAGLVGIGLASFPEKFKVQTLLLFCVVSLFLTIAASQLLVQLGLPVLSLPYVMTMWVAILSRVPKLNVNWAQQ